MLFEDGQDVFVERGRGGGPSLAWRGRGGKRDGESKKNGEKSCACRECRRGRRGATASVATSTFWAEKHPRGKVARKQTGGKTALRESLATARQPAPERISRSCDEFLQISDDHPAVEEARRNLLASRDIYVVHAINSQTRAWGWNASGAVLTRDTNSTAESNTPRTRSSSSAKNKMW
jgi:hypothetical protein